jgi:HK97 family phage prohead protease
VVALRTKGFIRIVRQKGGVATQPDQQSKSEIVPPIVQKQGRKVMKWSAQCDISSPGAKKFTPVKDASDNVVDYRDVTLTGYLSTFKNVTEADRDGDYVEQGAFRDTIAKFMRNPVLLVNHRNQVENLAGSFTKLQEDKNGLYFVAALSNSPSDRMKDIRALVAEGHLKTTSMGGLFHYKEDGRGIFKVDLWEGSLTPIPANPDALFSIREATEAELKQVTLEASEAEPNPAE